MGIVNCPATIWWRLSQPKIQGLEQKIRLFTLAREMSQISATISSITMTPIQLMFPKWLSLRKLPNLRGTTFLAGLNPWINFLFRNRIPLGPGTRISWLKNIKKILETGSSSKKCPSLISPKKIPGQSTRITALRQITRMRTQTSFQFLRTEKKIFAHCLRRIITRRKSYKTWASIPKTTKLATSLYPNHRNPCKNWGKNLGKNWGKNHTSWKFTNPTCKKPTTKI